MLSLQQRLRLAGYAALSAGCAVINLCSAQAQTPAPVAALQQIVQAANELCISPPMGGTSNNMSGSVKADASFGGFIRKMVGLGLSVDGTVSHSSSTGFLQSDLATAVRDADTCKLQVLQILDRGFSWNGFGAPPVAQTAPNNSSAAVVTVLATPYPASLVSYQGYPGRYAPVTYNFTEHGGTSVDFTSESYLITTLDGNTQIKGLTKSRILDDNDTGNQHYVLHLAKGGQASFNDNLFIPPEFCTVPDTNSAQKQILFKYIFDGIDSQRLAVRAAASVVINCD